MLSVKRLIWDKWNVAHLARHGVTPDEVEDICTGDPVVQQGHSGRILVFGPVKSGKMLTVVLDQEGNRVYYPVTARPTSRRERVIYQQKKGGGTS